MESLWSILSLLGNKKEWSINVIFKMKLVLVLNLKNGVKIALDLGIGNILIKKLKSMQSKWVKINLLSDLGIFP